MRIRLSDPSLAPRLVAYLAERHDSVVARVSDTDVEISLLGSLAVDAAGPEVERRLQAWREAYPDVEATIVDGEPSPEDGGGRRPLPAS